jgi:hypothetical protein
MLERLITRPLKNSYAGYTVFPGIAIPFPPPLGSSSLIFFKKKLGTPTWSCGLPRKLI